jgi:hypothetical protein
MIMSPLFQLLRRQMVCQKRFPKYPDGKSRTMQKSMDQLPTIALAAAAPSTTRSPQGELISRIIAQTLIARKLFPPALARLDFTG